MLQRHMTCFDSCDICGGQLWRYGPQEMIRMLKQEQIGADRKFQWCKAPLVLPVGQRVLPSYSLLKDALLPRTLNIFNIMIHYDFVI